jgi:hypothetical protein
VPAVCSELLLHMNIQYDVIGLVLCENCKSKQVTNFIAWPSRCHNHDMWFSLVQSNASQMTVSCLSLIKFHASKKDPFYYLSFFLVKYILSDGISQAFLSFQFVDVIIITDHDLFWNVGQRNCILKYLFNLCYKSWLLLLD